LCANNTLSRVCNIIILSLGRAQDGEPSAFVGPEILSVRIAELYQRINKVPSFACVADLQLRRNVARSLPRSECLSEHGLFDVLVRTVTWLHCDRTTSLTSKNYLGVTNLLVVAADQRSRL
jgi:hypothetical protein